MQTSNNHFKNCLDLYNNSGPAAVYSYANTNNLPYSNCQQCEADTPTIGNYCAICSSKKKPAAPETNKGQVLNTLLKTIGDTIKETSPTPAGTLYAGLMQYGCSLQTFNTIKDAFVRAGKVQEKGNLLYWID